MDGENCDAKVTFQDVIQHYLDHNKVTALKKQELKVKLPCKWTKKAATSEKYKWHPTEFTLDNQTFLMCMKIRKDIVYHWVYMLGSPDEAKHFSYTLKLFGPKVTNTSEARVAAIDESFQALFESGKCFAMPRKCFVAQIVDEECNYELSLEIRNLKKEVKDDYYESGISDSDEESK